MPDGDTPHHLTLCAFEENVDYVKPGDRVEVVGIYRAQGLRVNSKQRVMKNIFITYIDVVSYQIIDSTRMVNTNEKEGGDCTMEDHEKDNGLQQNITFSDRQITEFKKFAASGRWYERLVEAFSPSIWENDDIKKGVILQLFGGTNRDFTDSGRGRFRSSINILLVGDPSTAKSQVLQSVYRIAHRKIYTSGKGSSAVGLTAYVTKDPETGEFILESGALVLADKGICCIDEFDKMNDGNKSLFYFINLSISNRILVIKVSNL